MCVVILQCYANERQECIVSNAVWTYRCSCIPLPLLITMLSNDVSMNHGVGLPPTYTLIKLVTKVVVSVVRSLRDCRIKVSIAVPSDNNNRLQEALPHDVGWSGGCCDP